MNNVFTPEVVKDMILDYINDLDHLLFNEKDLQIYLAIKLKELNYKVYTEYRLPKGFNKKFDRGYKLWQTEKPAIDIVLEHDGKFIAVELKYKLKEIKGILKRFGQESSKNFPIVTNQAAQNEARYDFWKDVKRLELIQEHYNILGGVALFMTNDESYKNTNENCEYSKFGLDEKKEKGLLHWGKNNKPKLGKKKIIKRGKVYYERPNFELLHSYVGKWTSLSLPYEKDFADKEFHVYSVIVDNSNKNLSFDTQSSQS